MIVWRNKEKRERRVNNHFSVYTNQSCEWMMVIQLYICDQKVVSSNSNTRKPLEKIIYSQR